MKRKIFIAIVQVVLLFCFFTNVEAGIVREVAKKWDNVPVAADTAWTLIDGNGQPVTEIKPSMNPVSGQPVTHIFELSVPVSTSVYLVKKFNAITEIVDFEKGASLVAGAKYQFTEVVQKGFVYEIKHRGPGSINPKVTITESFDVIMQGSNDPPTDIVTTFAQTIGVLAGKVVTAISFPGSPSTALTHAIKGTITAGGSPVTLPGHDVVGQFEIQNLEALTRDLQIAVEGYYLNTVPGANIGEVILHEGHMAGNAAGSTIGSLKGVDIGFNANDGTINEAIALNLRANSLGAGTYPNGIHLTRVENLFGPPGTIASLSAVIFENQTGNDAPGIVVENKDPLVPSLVDACEIQATAHGEGCVRSNGSASFNGPVYIGPYIAVGSVPQSLVDSGAISVDTDMTYLSTTGPAAVTLPDGREGQQKRIVMIASAGAATVTPTSLFNGTTLTFTNVDDSATLIFSSGIWVKLHGTAVKG